MYHEPVTILQAYIYLSRHIRKGMLIGRNIASDLCDTAVGWNRENVKGELCMNVLIAFSIIVCCLVTE